MKNAALRMRAAAFGLLVSLCCASVHSQSVETPATDTPGAIKLEAIIVTGSHIHGAEVAGSKLIVISREQIDLSGYERIEDVLATVTQNFNRGNSAVRDGEEVNNYDNRGSEVQLRGLGLGTTLTLVNGQRQGATGYQGSFVDISSIPGSAVDRIEILPEGASALYGADAIGGVVNIILRNDFDGFEVRARASTAGGDATERTLAALWGYSGASGHVLLGLQYDDSRALACSARAACASNGDLRRFGGSDFRQVGGNPGTVLFDPATSPQFAAIPHGQDGSNLALAQLIPGEANYTNTVVDNQILPQLNMRSAFLSAAYRLSDRWELTIDGRYSSRAVNATFPQPPGNFLVPTENPFNHLGIPVTVAYDFNTDVGPIVDDGRTTTSFLSAGIHSALSHGWQLRLSTAYSKSSTRFLEYNTLNTDAVAAALGSADPVTALNVFGDGSHSAPAVLAALREQSVLLQYPDEFTTAMTSVIGDGPLFTGPAGPLRLALGADFRREHSTGLNVAFSPENRGRDAAAAFAELAVPLVGPVAGSSLDRVGLSLAGRYDHYSDAGSTFNPKVGLSWRPSRSLKLRANWGTSFRPPPFYWSNPDLMGDASVQNVIDPKSPTGFSRALLLFGTFPNLRSETSTAWSIGTDLVPIAAPNFSLSLTYFNIDYKGKIHNPGPSAAQFLTRETEFGSLITRNPTPAQIDAACKGIRRFVSGSIGNCTDPITAILDNRFRNLTMIRTRGVDFNVGYAVDSVAGRWTFGLDGTYTFIQEQQITATSPVFDFINTVGNPVKLRWAAHLSRSFKGWSAQATVNHTGAYRDSGSVPARGVDSWTTVDLNVSYRTADRRGRMANFQCNLGINNVFNQSPPFVNQFDGTGGALGYDPANASLLGRQIGLQIVKQWNR